jgi:putative glutamine amidotransferase
VLPRKRIEIEDDSRLAQIMRCNPCYVNALHHQAVNRVGEGLKVVARDQHNIVQAVEAADRDFVVCVQWHPEMLPFSNSNLNLFKSLTAAVA